MPQWGIVLHPICSRFRVGGSTGRSPEEMAMLKVVEQTVILRSGRIVFQGSAAELGAHADLWQWF